mmetsp:Transcript_45087/g.127261  ORF Transcript_45087/g.127261 Transcript_45087/m.127261 type:complete len:190 (+) Transcript_45087:1302-1871(+)
MIIPIHPTDRTIGVCLSLCQPWVCTTLQWRLPRSHASSCVSVVRDGQQLAALKGKADIVLVDAPCSSLGALRRHPGLRWQLNQTETTLPALQTAILLGARDYVRPGGLLVYATCALSRHENDHVAAVMDRQSGFAPCPCPLLTSAINAGELCGEVGRSGHCTLFPSGGGGTDGFFVARWTREDTGVAEM